MRYVVIIMADQHAARALGCAGHSEVQTPCLDDLASRSTVFTQAYTPAPVCVPARFSALSGLYPSHTGCVDNSTPLPITTPTAAHFFREAGYLTAFIGKMHPVDPQTHGFDYYLDFGHYYDYLGRKLEIFTRGMGADDSGKGVPWMEMYQDPENSWELVPPRAGMPTNLPEKDHFEPFVVREALRFLQQYHHHPLFVFVSFLRPHTPLVVPDRFYQRYRWEDLTGPQAPAPSQELNPYLRSRMIPESDRPEAIEVAKRHLQRYYAAVSFVDEQVGALLRGIEGLGMEDETLVLYTSDHGDMLFDHGMLGKFTCYEASVKVPFLVHLPGQSQGRRTAALVDHTVLLPSLLDAIGCPRDALDGHSVYDEWAGTPAASERPVFSELRLAQDRTMHMVRDHDWKLITYPDGFRQLFHLASDPGELQNKAGEGIPVEAELEAVLSDHRHHMGDEWRKFDGPNPRV